MAERVRNSLEEFRSRTRAAVQSAARLSAEGPFQAAQRLLGEVASRSARSVETAKAVDALLVQLEREQGQIEHIGRHCEGLAELGAEPNETPRGKPDR